MTTLSRRQARRAARCRDAVKVIPVASYGRPRHGTHHSPRTVSPGGHRRGCHDAVHHHLFENKAGHTIVRLRFEKHFCWKPKPRNPNKGKLITYDERLVFSHEIEGIAQLFWDYRGVTSKADWRFWDSKTLERRDGTNIKVRGHISFREPLFKVCIPFRDIGCFQKSSPVYRFRVWPRYFSSLEVRDE